MQVSEELREQDRDVAERLRCIPGVLTGRLVGFRAAGEIPLVTYPGQPGTAALVARSITDLQGGHIGREVVLMFDGGDPARPIVMGCVRQTQVMRQTDQDSPVEVDVDGERLLVSAAEQLVLRCGKASVTLTKAGKILIQGTYIASRSSGVHRIKGGSVQIN